MLKSIEKNLCISIFFVSALFYKVQGQNLNVVFWTEPTQLNINDDISSGVNEISKLASGVSIKDSTIVVDNENSDYEHTALNTFCEILSTEGVSVVVDFTYHHWQLGTRFLAKHQIPLIRVDRALSPFLHMFGVFLKHKGGNDVVLILQSEQDKHEALYHMIEGFPFRTLLINAMDEHNFVRRLRELRPIPSYFAIFAKTSNMNNIFEKINKSKLFARPKEWHFIFLDTRDKSFKYDNQIENATKFVIDSKSICKSLGMTNDAYCSNSFTFQRALIYEILRSLVNFLKSDSNLAPINVDCNSTASEEHVDQSSSPPDLANKLTRSDFMSLSEYVSYEAEMEAQTILTYSMNVSISTHSNAETTNLAVWAAGELLKINETISPAKRFFRIGVTEAIPWNYYRRDKRTNELILDDEGNPIWDGYCIEFIDSLAEKLNFGFELITPKKGKFGKRDMKTGRWDGIIGDLVSGETDFAVTALKMYSEREEVVDFVAPYFDQTGISIVMRKPVRQTSLFKFMTVLRLEVWLSIIGALVATAVMIWLLDKYSPYSSRNNPEAYPYPCREFTLRESFWFALTSFTPQGGGEAPKAVSGRILVAAYWLFVVLMLATFTANLAAFLTVERMQAPVQSLEQLARQSRINYTVVADSDTHQYFINMKFAEDTLYRMWKELVLNASPDFHKFRIWDYPIKEQYGHILLAINASEPVADVAQGYQKVNERESADFAFIHDSSEIKYEITQNCNFTEVGDVFGEQPYAIAVQQGSHLSDELSYTILELQKDRYFEDLRAKYWNRSLIKECSASEDQEGITLESLGGVFIATLVGLGLAMITLAVEVFYYKKRHSENLVKATGKIKKVKPIDERGGEPSSRNIAIAWHSDTNKSDPKITPPPSFESATYFRGRKIPNTITLGGEEFKSKRFTQRGSVEGSQKSIGKKFEERSSDKVNSTLPPYME